MSSRTTSIGGVISLLGAFLASALVLGLLAAGLVMPAVGATGALARSGVDVFNELPSEFTHRPAGPDRRRSSPPTAPSSRRRRSRTAPSCRSSKIAPIMREAQVAIEDHRFYEHGGIDLQGTSARSISNLRNGSSRRRLVADAAVRQDLAAVLRPQRRQRGRPPPTRCKKDYMRKLKELKYAITLEKKLTKDQILEGYLNLVYYGDRAYGVEAAAQHYFSVHAEQAQPLAGGAARRPDAEPRHDRPGELPGAGARPPQRRARPHARARPDHRQAVDRRRRSARSSRTCRSRNPRARASPRPTPTGATSSSTTRMTMPQLGKTVEERKRTLYRGGITITDDARPASAAHRAGGDQQEGADRQRRPHRRGVLRRRPQHRPGARLRPEHDVHRRQGVARQDRHRLGARQEVRRLRRLPVRLDGQGVRPRHRHGVRA